MNGIAPHLHPEPDVLAAFVDGSSSGQELRDTARHLHECPECRQIVGEAARFEREEESPAAQDPPATHSRWWLAAAAAVVLVAIALPVGQHFLAFADPIASLHQGPQRVTAGRIARLEHRPYNPPRGHQTNENYEAERIAQDREKALEKDRSADNLHFYAVALMVAGKASEAVAPLREASSLAPENAEILSDLAAVELAAGKTDEAIADATKALQLDPKSAPAAFNKARALQLQDDPRAIEAWKAYLKLEPKGPWSDEASANLEEDLRARQRHQG